MFAAGGSLIDGHTRHLRAQERARRAEAAAAAAAAASADTDPAETSSTAVHADKKPRSLPDTPVGTDSAADDKVVPLLDQLPTPPADDGTSSPRRTPRMEDLSIRESTPNRRSRKRTATGVERGHSDPAPNSNRRRGILTPKKPSHPVDPDFDRGPARNHQPVLFDPEQNGMVHSLTWDVSANTGLKSSPSDPRANPRPRRATVMSTPRSPHSRRQQPQPLEDEPLPPVLPMILEPETRPISEEQLINEVRGIYAGLVMVEKKCVEIDQQQVQSNNKLNNDQWQALIALHRTLLHEHHDFFLASQHPSASPALRRLASKYAMPARMWRHGIHSFLELLRHRLPDALDHMLAFINTAYSMMALLMESVPAFEDTWIECLGDLARYRMAVEEADLRDREVWAGVARHWYNKAADKSPLVGRIQHHLAVLARPNILQQLFFYTKSLVCVQPFPNTRESILLLFNPLLSSNPPSHRHLPVMASFVRAHGTLFTRGSIRTFVRFAREFMGFLGPHIGRVGSKWREQGVYIASANFTSILEYGTDGDLMKLYSQAYQKLEGSRETFFASMHESWANVSSLSPLPDFSVPSDDSKFENPAESFFCASCLTFYTFSFVLRHIGDKNVFPHVHVTLAFLWSLALIPEAMIRIEGEVPWSSLVAFLNTISWQGISESRLQSESFPILDESSRHLPEDYFMRGQIWSQFYHSPGFFDGSSVDDEERFLELPSMAVLRSERCLWLGYRLASFDRWITHDNEAKKFEAKPFALDLERTAKHSTVFEQTPNTPEPVTDANMEPPAS